MESDSPSPSGAHFHGWHQIGKSCQWPYDDRPAIAAERGGLEYGTFSALRLFVLLLHLFPENRCAPPQLAHQDVVHRAAPDPGRPPLLAVPGKLWQGPCRGELLHACSSAKLQATARTTDMAPEQEDPMPSSLHSCTFGPKAPIYLDLARSFPVLGSTSSWSRCSAST
jgi:hypothetical protein